MADEPIDHVLRSLPPWDESVMTECGKTEVKGTLLTREQFVAKVKKQGQQRSALTTCMTCWNTAGNYRPWSESPTECVRRWLTRVNYRTDEEPHDTHLRAVAALIEAHQDEYDGYIAGVDQTEDLAARRRQRDLGKAQANRFGRSDL